MLPCPRPHAHPSNSLHPPKTESRKKKQRERDGRKERGNGGKDKGETSTIDGPSPTGHTSIVAKIASITIVIAAAPDLAFLASALVETHTTAGQPPAPEHLHHPLSLLRQRHSTKKKGWKPLTFSSYARSKAKRWSPFVPLLHEFPSTHDEPI